METIKDDARKRPMVERQEYDPQEVGEYHTFEEFTKMPEYQRAISDTAEVSSYQCVMFGVRKAR